MLFIMCNRAVRTDVFGYALWNAFANSAPDCGTFFWSALEKKLDMRKINFFIVLLSAAIFSACNNSNDADRGGEKDPSVMHPPSQAIPDSTKLVNDSVIVPDLTPGNGRQVGKSDSIQIHKH